MDLALKVLAASFIGKPTKVVIWSRMKKKKKVPLLPLPKTKFLGRALSPITYKSLQEVSYTHTLLLTH
jgi:hypothetical protein